MSETSTLAESVSELKFQNIPEDVRDRATELIRDFIGVGIAGSETEVGQKLLSYRSTMYKGTRATTFNGKTTSPLGAALVNGTCGEAMAYDDTFESIVIHPSTSVFPAILAAAEMEKASGQDLLTGYVAGVETIFRIGLASHPSHYEHGFHSTGTIGVFGAAVGAASIFDLTVTEVKHMLGIAGSLSSSLRKNGGSMTFSLHGGHAAQMGLQAATLAREGVTADLAVFDDELNYGEVMIPGDTFDPEKLVIPIGEEWGINDVGIKAYPCARVPQAAMDALASIVRRQDLIAEEVRSVTVEFDPSLAGILERENPDDAYAARGSIEFCLAAVLQEGNAGISQFQESYLHNERTQASMSKIKPTYESELGDEFSRYGARVVVKTEEGDRYAEEEYYAPGSPENPLSEKRAEKKARQAITSVRDPDVADQILRVVDDLSNVDGVDKLTNSLRE